MSALAAVAALATLGAAEPDASAPPVAPGPLIEPTQPATRACRICPHACSSRTPVCVHAGAGRQPAGIPGVLAAADRAWDAVVRTMGAPPPEGDVDGRWRVELAEGIEGGAEARLLARDPLARFDRAASFARVDPSVAPGCALDFAVARAVARGSIWRAAPSTDEATASAEAGALASLATPCAPSGEDVRTFQDDPERGLIDRGSPAHNRGARLFYNWLDTTFGAEPGGLIIGLWALAPTHTPVDAARWSGEPTGFDVLRVSLKNTLWPGSTLDDILVRFAISRATMNPATRLAWHIGWPSSARRLAAPSPVSPTGASYILVDRLGAPPASKLRVEAEWEDYGRMRWVVVKLDAAGRTLAELPIGAPDNATRAAMTIESLDQTDRVLVVGVGLGSRGASNPNEGEWEPHGWLLTLAQE